MESIQNRIAETRLRIANLNHSLPTFSRDIGIARFELPGSELPDSRFRIADSLPLCLSLSLSVSLPFSSPLSTSLSVIMYLLISLSLSLSLSPAPFFICMASPLSDPLYDSSFCMLLVLPLCMYADYAPPLPFTLSVSFSGEWSMSCTLLTSRSHTRTFQCRACKEKFPSPGNTQEI